MNSKKSLISATTVFVLLFTIILLDSCANIVPPLGGPRDTLPPLPVGVNPKDSTLNFTGNRITLNFNEYVQVDNPQENLMISPTPTINPQVEGKLRTVTIRLKDTLEPNTTYVIDFGKSIRDINENNALENFTYTFSTGSYIDSIELGGNILVAETGKADSTLIVMLHRDQTDSAVAKEKPRYYTRVDKDGNFMFHHLAAGTYVIYGMKDEGGMRRYTSPAQMFAFADSPVVLSGKIRPAPIQLYAYTEPEPPKPVKKVEAPAKKKGEEKDQDRRLQFTTNLANETHDVLDTLLVNFPEPLKTFDSTKLILTDEKFVKLEGYSIEKDSTHKIISIHYKWPFDHAFHLIAEKGMASDSADKSILKNDTIAFRTLKESDYGSIKFRFANLDTSIKPVLQLVQNDQVKFSFPVKGKELLISRFRPAEFELRMLYDANENGKWDHGIFFGKKRQPEIVETIGKKINVRANWDNEIDITL